MSFTDFKTICLAFLLVFYLALCMYLGLVVKVEESTLMVLPILLAAALCLLLVFVRPMYRVYKRWAK